MVARVCDGKALLYKTWVISTENFILNRMRMNESLSHIIIILQAVSESNCAKTAESEGIWIFVL